MIKSSTSTPSYPDLKKITIGYPKLLEDNNTTNVIATELKQFKTALQSMCPECLARFKVNVNKNRMSEGNQTRQNQYEHIQRSFT